MRNTPFWRSMKNVIDPATLRMLWERLQWSEPVGRSGAMQMEPVVAGPVGRRTRQYRLKRKRRNGMARLSRRKNR